MRKSFKTDYKFMMILFGLFTAPFFTPQAKAQLYNFTEEQMISFTAKNPYSRFPGGRPMIPAAILDTIRKMDIQVVEAIGSIPKEYANQYEDGWKSIVPGKKLIVHSPSSLCLLVLIWWQECKVKQIKIILPD